MMIKSIISCSSRRLLLQQQQQRRRRCLVVGRCLFSSSSSSNNAATNLDELIKTSPGQLVSGLTVEDVEKNPKILEFLHANFADDSSTSDGGESVSAEDLIEYGFTQEEIDSLAADSAISPLEKYNTPRIDQGLGKSDEQQALNIRTLFTYTRTEEGSNACKKLRSDNKLIPGMLYGPSNGSSGSGKGTIDDKKVLIKTPWSELQRELDRYHRYFESRVYDITIYEDESDSTEGYTSRVVPRDVQRHPVKGDIYCANFLRYYPGRPLKIPIVYVNQEESPALKRDGYIIPVNKFVECIVEDGVQIPEHLELECTGVQVKDILKLDRIEFPDGVQPSHRVNVDTFIVGPVRGGGRGSATDSDDIDGTTENDEDDED